MPNPVGPIIPADENFTHQVTETFASVGTTDPSWTEKVCAMAMANDGSLQIGFGLGNCQPIAYGPWPKLGLEDDPWM